MNEVIDFGKSGIYLHENDLRQFVWSVVSKNDKISSFKKGITKKTLPLTIKCNSEEEGISTKNRLYEICEKDVLAKKHGKLIIGDYYLKCFVIGSKPSEYLKSKSYMKTDITISTDFPSWIKETTTLFRSIEPTIGKNFDYNYDFPHDYASNMLNQRLNNNNFVASNFRIVVYGIANKPRITIGGHDYEANVDIANNEYLTIDSIEKTIVLTRADGSTQNCFHLRNKESYIFEKIPSGSLEVSTSSDFSFDVTLLEERGIPRWT